MSDRVQVTFDGGIAIVRLSRPEKLNGLDLPMFEELVEAGDRITADKSVRACVLHGEGKGFCAGLDFQSVMGDQRAFERLLERVGGSPANLAQRVSWIWQEVPVPVIAAVHGVTYGGGLQIALGADIRYVAPDAKLSVMEIKWGLVPDMGITQTLLRLVRVDVAKELTFTGRVFSGTEAKELGLATHLSDDPLNDALALARIIASKSPDAIRATKKLYGEAVELTRAQALALETALQVPLLGSANQMEAVQANMMKREPAFTDPD